MEEEFDIYTEEGMETFVDDDGISAAEEGFMLGYLGAQKCLTFLRKGTWTGKNTRKKSIYSMNFGGDKKLESRV